jgi:hypothetical protein
MHCITENTDTRIDGVSIRVGVSMGDLWVGSANEPAGSLLMTGRCTCWLQVSSIILFILNVDVKAEDNGDDKNDFCEDLQCVFNQFTLHNVNMLGTKIINSECDDVLDEKICAVSSTHRLHL